MWWLIEEQIIRRDGKWTGDILVKANNNEPLTTQYEAELIAILMSTTRLKEWGGRIAQALRHHATRGPNIQLWAVRAGAKKRFWCSVSTSADVEGFLLPWLVGRQLRVPGGAEVGDEKAGGGEQEV